MNDANKSFAKLSWGFQPNGGVSKEQKLYEIFFIFLLSTLAQITKQ